MNKAQVLILITMIALAVYYFSQTQNKPVKPKKINPAIQLTAAEILYAPPAELFPDPLVPPTTKKSPINSSLSPEKSQWFTEKHWLTDQEIDWALSQVINNLPAENCAKYKVLESTQFMFAKEVLNNPNDPAARDSFPTLLSELTDPQYDLVFIPVNNPDFHWSLLVWEQATKCFWHFDTLRGANHSYLKSLVTELIKHIWQDNEPDLKQYLQTQYGLPQGNTWDCGIAVIEIAKKLMQDYAKYERIFIYTRSDFDFPTARNAWHHQLNYA